MYAHMPLGFAAKSVVRCRPMGKALLQRRPLPPKEPLEILDSPRRVCVTVDLADQGIAHSQKVRKLGLGQRNGDARDRRQADREQENPCQHFSGAQFPSFGTRRRKP